MRGWLAAGVVGLFLMSGPAVARAQEAQGALLPLGGAGYVPYSGGGLGVYPSMGRMRQAGATPMRGIGMPGPRGIGPARPRGGIEPLAPITGGSMGVARGTGMGTGKAMGRRPVGTYPFRQPPSLTRPSAGGAMPAM